MNTINSTWFYRQRYCYLLTALLAIGIPVSGHAVQGPWYLGLSAGSSQLEPETSGSGLTLDDSSSMAAGLFIGLDINDWISSEFALSTLGAAELSDGTDIDYQVFSVGALAYVLGEKHREDRHFGPSGFVRLGLNAMNIDAAIDLEEANNTALWLGAGLQWPVSADWGIRAELSSYDGDAQAALLSLYWRPLSWNRKMSGNTAGLPAAQTHASPTDRDTRDTSGELAKVNEELKSLHKDQPPIAVPSREDCAVAAINEPRDAAGCALFSGVIPGIDFELDSATLTPGAESVLKQLADSLNQYPELLVEIQAHSASYQDERLAKDLASRRAVAVARALSQHRVSVNRLRARTFGSTRPRADNTTAAGRGANSRIELKVLSGF